MHLVMLGAPGAGKGTQAERLATCLHVPHVSSGDLFRENLRQETDLGSLAQQYMGKGRLVPDDVTIAMVRERLRRPDCDGGVILDGFPRTLAQAQALDSMLTDKGRGLAEALYIAVPEAELVRRLSGRWVCSQCQSAYHTVANPPSTPGLCDACAGKLYQRDDDRPETVLARLKVYHQQTAPLIDYYRATDRLVEIDGAGDIDTVSAIITEAVGSLADCESGQLP